MKSSVIQLASQTYKALQLLDSAFQHLIFCSQPIHLLKHLLLPLLAIGNVLSAGDIKVYRIFPSELALAEVFWHQVTVYLCRVCSSESNDR